AQRMVARLAALAKTIDSMMPADAIDPAFQQLKGGWGQSFLLKAFGALVVAPVNQRGAATLVGRTCRRPPLAAPRVGGGDQAARRLGRDVGEALRVPVLDPDVPVLHLVPVRIP